MLCFAVLNCVRCSEINGVTQLFEHLRSGMTRWTSKIRFRARVDRLRLQARDGVELLDRRGAQTRQRAEHRTWRLLSRAIGRVNARNTAP